MWRWAVLLLITIGLGFAFYWQSAAQKEPPTDSTRAENTQKLIQFRAFELDERGRVKSELRGESWTQTTDKVSQQTPSDTLHLFTSNLDYNQTQATLTTQSPIVIQSSFGELKGKGLSAWLNEEKIQIHSDVKGIYVEH
jgi:lipopolysaccharide export system protein LptC